MIDHTGITVSDFEQSKKFYKDTLAAIGYGILVEFSAEITGKSAAAGFGEGRKPDFWLVGGTPSNPPVHLAFGVKDRATVDAFHKAGLAAGAKDNGAPGIRAHYHPNYYGAFLLDADGNNIEAVCHSPE